MDHTNKDVHQDLATAGSSGFCYLGDILLVGENPIKLKKDLDFVLETFQQSGMQLNLKKCVLAPVQQVEHLGFLLDLKSGLLKIPQNKMEFIQKELRQLKHKDKLSPRKMASILGSVRSFLMAFPHLRCFTDMMLAFTGQASKKG